MKKIRTFLERMTIKEEIVLLYIKTKNISKHHDTGAKQNKLDNSETGPKIILHVMYEIPYFLDSKMHY